MCEVSAKNIELYGTESSSKFRQRFLENNRALSKSLYGVSHY